MAPFTPYPITFHTGLIFTLTEKFVGVYTTPFHSVVPGHTFATELVLIAIMYWNIFITAILQ